MIASAIAERLRIHVYGAVQGVGFRPFVYRLARELRLAGSVCNSASGVFIEVEGVGAACEEFVRRMHAEKPAPSWIAGAEITRLAPTGQAEFRIAESEEGAPPTAAILPDLTTCPECLEEVFDPVNRRFRYPFTNCTHCGPRYTILTDLPYDRPNTTMKGFRMCASCEAEYRSPENRRFHAQPNACPVCGPKVWTEPCAVGPAGQEAVESVVAALRAGHIVALKGIGGFQLLADAANPAAIRRLRQRKHREEKPFAVLFPEMDTVRRAAICGTGEEALLSSPAAPIVLLRRRDGGLLAPEVCMASPHVGAMLPYSPLHHLVAREFGGPLVATSGNGSDDPIAIDNREACTRLAGIADMFLLHDRPIARQADDSVARLSRGREMVLRRGRGYAPLPVRVRADLPRVLALGGHMKSVVAIGWDRQVVVSQHIGDLDTLEARDAFERTVHDLMRLYEFRPELVVCDLHPDYYSSQFAATLPYPVVRVQHHHAHVAACAAENDIDRDYLGVAWDGTGYGTDGTIWGGEFFLMHKGRFERVAHLRPFRLPGGEAAVRDCRRSALAVLRDTFGEALPLELGFSEKQLTLLGAAANAPVTTSAGRLFDAIAAITGCALRNGYEGQAGMALEAAAMGAEEAAGYELPFENGELDWRPLVAAIVADLSVRSRAEIARGFHAALAAAIASVAREFPRIPVVLSGGVFQNTLLVDEICARVPALTHQRIPPNDGGIALGQAVLSGAALPREMDPCV
jgi:hydrogenase maturation protein HypF